MSVDERPLRADAARNRQRILDAAAEVFGRRGLAATLDDVAAHAGVGVGTVYRRFADKDALLDELFDARIGQIVAIAQEQVEVEDPWDALRGFLERTVELQASDRGLRELIHDPGRAQDRVRAARERLIPLVSALLTRAQLAGEVREDLAPSDVAMVTLTLTTVIDATAELQPDFWRRWFALLLAAMRPGDGPLPGRALTPDEFDEALRAAHR